MELSKLISLEAFLSLIMVYKLEQSLYQYTKQSSSYLPVNFMEGSNFLFSSYACYGTGLLCKTNQCKYHICSELSIVLSFNPSLFSCQY